MKIADIELGEKPLLLAPMEDVTDPSFRYMCKRFGADVVYTEFISSDGLIRDAAKSLKKLEIDAAERPVGIQLYGHLIEPMVEAARMAEAGWQYNPNSELLRIFKEVWVEKFGEEPKVVAIHACLECGLFAKKIPGLDLISLGPNMYDVHTPDERLSISSTIRIWEYLKLVLARLK